MIHGQQALQALALVQLHIEQDSKDCKSAPPLNETNGASVRWHSSQARS